MNFQEDKPIYLQIGEWICNKILRGEWPAGERIPSVRELGALLEVNPNTVMRTFERLQGEGIIHNQRGIGYFVSPDAARQILRREQSLFFEEELPRLFERMETLGLSEERLLAAYRTYQSNHNRHENKS